MNRNEKNIQYQLLFLRWALATALLSAVADRLGMWPAALSNWGNWKSFEDYTRQLTFFLPEWMSRASAYVATAAEVILGLFLIIGFQLKWTALFTAALLLFFGLSMIVALGVKSTFDYSVWVGCAGALLLSSQYTSR